MAAGDTILYAEINDLKITLYCNQGKISPNITIEL